MNQASQDKYDFIIIGSGGGAISAALVAKLAGKSPLILEKTDLVGGSTAWSGGVLWIPDSGPMHRAGVGDSLEAARTYLAGCAGDASSPASTPEKRETFLREGPRTVDFLEKLGMKFTYPKGWPDYHVRAVSGGHESGRSLEAAIFNTKRLGAWRSRLRRHTGIRAYPLSTPEIAQIFLGGRTLKSALTYVRLAFRLAQRAVGRDLVRRGSALQGRLLEIALRHKIPIWINAGVQDLIVENGKVTGVIVEREGQALRLSATHGVLINAGGFSHNLAMRQKYQPEPASVAWTWSNPGDTGEMISTAVELGAATDLMDLAWWNVAAVMPGGGTGSMLLDIAKPHAIVVDSSGQRYVNEGTSYVAFGIAMHERHKEVPAVPSWMIFDDQHCRKYWLAGSARPGKTPQEWISSGFLKRADTIEGLAAELGLPATQLRRTIERFNSGARAGKDPDFNRGFSSYDWFYGDPTNKPNAALGPIERGPFYAIQLIPGDVGTSGGVVTDEFARVLRDDGSPIDGLYATGNSTASVSGRSYPGAGMSIGASMVFGYVAARHALGLNA